VNPEKPLGWFIGPGETPDSTPPGYFYMGPDELLKAAKEIRSFFLVFRDTRGDIKAYDPILNRIDRMTEGVYAGQLRNRAHASVALVDRGVAGQVVLVDRAICEFRTTAEEFLKRLIKAPAMERLPVVLAWWHRFFCSGPPMSEDPFKKKNN
jgi:hypothetical protein